MRATAQLQQFKKCLILFMVGIVCSALAYAVYVINPLKMLKEYKIAMNPTSTIFTLWKKPPLDVYMKVYIFNITNPVEFLAGEEKLRLEEVGPYVYQEVIVNDNVTWNDNGTLSYIPRRTVSYVPEMSVGDQQDRIIVPNIALLGISSALSDAGFVVNFGFNQLARYLESEPIMNLSVYDYFWGYDEPLVNLAGTVVPNFIPFTKLGLLDRMYDEGENVVTINLHKNENMTDEEGRYLSIDMYNGSPGLTQWGYQPEEDNITNPENTICNSIRGATDGSMFPQAMEKSAIFRVFRKAFCRTLPIVFIDEVTTDSGIPGYMYTISDSFSEPVDKSPETACYCNKMPTCLKRGLSDLTPCYYNIPAAVSLPHFLDADPSLLENIDGLHPESEKHRSKIIIQPEMGIPLKVNSRMQTNLVVRNTSNSNIAPFNDMVIPLIWTDLMMPGLRSQEVMLVKLLLQIGPVAQTVMICFLSIAGVTTFLLSLVGTLWVLNQQDADENKKDDSSDLRISLGYGQYTAIRILPAIKKITSRTDLFS